MALFRQKSPSSKSVIESSPSGIPFSLVSNVSGSLDDQTVNSPQRPQSIRERTASLTNRIRTSSTSSINKLKRSASNASVSPSAIGHADGTLTSPSAGSSSSERKNRRLSLSRIFSGSSGNGRESEKIRRNYARQGEVSPGSPSGGSKIGLSQSISFGSLKSKKEARSLHRSSHQPQRTSRTPLTPEALPPQLSRSVTPPGQSPNPSLPQLDRTELPSASSRRVVSPVHTPMHIPPPTSSSTSSSPSKIPRRIRVFSNPPRPQLNTATSPVRARAISSYMVTPDQQRFQPQVAKTNSPIASSSSSSSRVSQAPSFLLEDPFSTPPPPEIVQPSTSSATAVSLSSSPSTAFDLLQTIQRERSNRSAHTTSTNEERTSSNLKRSSSQAESILGGVLEREVEGGGRVSRSPSATRRRRLTGDMMRPREVSLSAKAESLNSPDLRSQTGWSSGVDSMILTPESPRSQNSPVGFGEESFSSRGVKDALGSPLREPAQTSTLPSSPLPSTTPGKIPIPLTNKLMDTLNLGRVMAQSSSPVETESIAKGFEAEKSASENQSEHAVLDEVSEAGVSMNKLETPSTEAGSCESEVPSASSNINSNHKDATRGDRPSNLSDPGFYSKHVHTAERLEQAQEEAGIGKDDDFSVTPTTTDRLSTISSPRLSYISEESLNVMAESSVAVNIGGDKGNDENGEKGKGIDTDYVREILKGFTAGQLMPSRASNKNQIGELDQVGGRKDIKNKKSDPMSEARDDYQGLGTMPELSNSTSPARVSNSTTIPTLDEPKPTLVSVNRLPKEAFGLPEVIQAELLSTRNDNGIRSITSSGKFANYPSNENPSTVSNDRGLFKQKEEARLVGEKQNLDKNLSGGRPDHVLSSLSESPDATILPPDVPPTTIDDVLASKTTESVLTNPSPERESSAVSEGAFASMAEQTLRQVLDPKRVLIKDQTGEPELYETRITNVDKNPADNSEEHRDDSLAGVSSTWTKQREPKSLESFTKESSNNLSPHPNTQASQYAEQPKPALLPKKDDHKCSPRVEQGQNDKKSSASLPSATSSISTNPILDLNQEIKDETSKHSLVALKAKIDPSASESHLQPVEQDAAVVSEQPHQPKVTSTPLIASPVPIKLVDVFPTSSRPNLQSRALTTPTRPSTPQRPQLSRAITTNSIELPNPFASLLNSQRFFVKVPISLLPTRLASFVQQTSFSIPSLFPRKVDPSEGARFRSLSPDSVQTIGCSSHSNDGSEPGSGFGSRLESGRALLGTAAGIVGTSVKWGFGWPVLVPLRAGQYVLSTLNSHADIEVGSKVKEKDKPATTMIES